jgi:hypothetical protein
MIWRRPWGVNSLFLLWLAATLLAGQHRPAFANGLGEEACKKLQTERQALVVLGIDKYFTKGAEWAKAHLTVADLNLVKRYLDVYEQLKFRCEKVIAIVEPDERDDEDDEESAAKPPIPKHNEVEEEKSAPSPETTAAGMTHPAREKKTARGVSTSDGVNAATIKIGPARMAPAQQ